MGVRRTFSTTPVIMIIDFRRYYTTMVLVELRHHIWVRRYSEWIQYGQPISSEFSLGTGFRRIEVDRELYYLGPPPALRRQTGICPSCTQLASSHGSITESDDVVGRDIGLVQGCRYLTSQPSDAPAASIGGHTQTPASIDFIFDWSSHPRCQSLIASAARPSLIKQGCKTCLYYIRDGRCHLDDCCYDHPPLWLVPRSVGRGQSVTPTPRPAGAVAPLSPAPSAVSISITPPIQTDGISYLDVPSTIGRTDGDGKYIKPTRIEGLMPILAKYKMYSYDYNIVGVSCGVWSLVAPGSVPWAAGYRSFRMVDARQDLVEENRLSVCGWTSSKKMHLGLEYNLSKDKSFLSTVSGDRIKAVETHSRLAAQANRLREVENDSFIRDSGGIMSGSLNWVGLPLFILAYFASLILRVTTRLSLWTMDVFGLSTPLVDSLRSGVPLLFFLGGDIVFAISVLTVLFSVHISGTMVLCTAALPILWETRYTDFSMTRMVSGIVLVVSVSSCVFYLIWSGAPLYVARLPLEHPVIIGLTWLSVRHISLTLSTGCGRKVMENWWRRGGSAISPVHSTV